MKLCWLYKKAVSRAVDADGKMPAWVTRHLDKCGHCRDHYRAQVCLTAALMESAPAECASPAPFLRSRIISALDQQEGPLPTPGMRFRPLRTWLIPAFGLFIIGMVWIWKPASSSTQRPVADGPLVGSAALPVTAPNGVDPAALLKWNENFKQPLESELQDMVDDAKAALLALGDNFLPSKFE
jgi:hypothetical protein